MAAESFYGVTLTSKNSKVEWDVLNIDEEYPRGQKLIIKQVLLGAEAKEDEFNVVEVQTHKDSIKIPIAVLKAGETRALNPGIEFHETSVTFKLIEGSGPVYIHGQVVKDDIEVVDWENEETEDDEEEDEEEEEEESQPKKKQKVENNIDGKHAKQKKK